MNVIRVLGLAMVLPGSVSGAQRNYGYGRMGDYLGDQSAKRIMVMINFNQDIGDYWEWSDRGFNVVPSNEAYKLGVNYLVYALTH